MAQDLANWNINYDNDKQVCLSEVKLDKICPCGQYWSLLLLQSV